MGICRIWFFESLKLEDERWEGKQEVWRVDSRGVLWLVTKTRKHNVL